MSFVGQVYRYLPGTQREGIVRCPVVDGCVCVCVCGTGDYHFIFPLDSTVLSYRHLYCIELGYCSIPPMNSH